MSKDSGLLTQIAPFRWRLSPNHFPGMRVPGEIIASAEMIPRIIADKTPQQVANVAMLPGIVGRSLAMPDIHWGYGFPIGGVAAFDLDEGVISPGGVGYDINCGVNLLRSDLRASDARLKIRKIVDELFQNIPCGVGSEGKIHLSDKDFDRVLEQGAGWVASRGEATQEDLLHMEEGGMLSGGDAGQVSARAKQRARKQLGTLGSGNHFIEVQEVAEVYHEDAAGAFGLFSGQVVVMIHSGSRGLGHQICDDSLAVMQRQVQRLGWELPDRQLACAPFRSAEAQNYLSAMKCAANFAWANRLSMAALARQVFAKVFSPAVSASMRMVYDVCHNIAKIEEHVVDGEARMLCVHRKGATRALAAGHPLVPSAYRKSGQPVIIPGDMGRASYVLAGDESSAEISFSSSCHGAGRIMSRNQALKQFRGDIIGTLEKRGIIVRADGKKTLVEEMPEAYKDVSEVVEAVHGAGISKRVARLKPLCTVKG